jgi:hypothetical protein
MNISSPGSVVEAGPGGGRYSLLNRNVIFRCGLGLGTAALQQGGVLLGREGLVLPQDDGPFVELDVQRVAGLELGLFAQLRRER